MNIVENLEAIHMLCYFTRQTPLMHNRLPMIYKMYITTITASAWYIPFLDAFLLNQDLHWILWQCWWYCSFGKSQQGEHCWKIQADLELPLTSLAVLQFSHIIRSCVGLEWRNIVIPATWNYVCASKAFIKENGQITSSSAHWTTTFLPIGSEN